jgi:hypothetical protein
MQRNNVLTKRAVAYLKSLINEIIVSEKAGKTVVSFSD